MYIQQLTTRFLTALCVCCAPLLGSTQVFAGPDALLGIVTTNPKFDISSNAGQGASFDGTQVVITSAPVFYTLTAGNSQFVANGDLTITASVDNTGTFTGGTFTISGDVGANTGVLLSGTVDDYGISNTGPNSGDVDFIDFALTANGGTLLADFGNGSAGAVIALEGSTFDGTFTAPWGALRAKGDIGYVPPPPTGVGTGTIGYWKNHPDAWPVSSLEIAGVILNQNTLISILKTPTRGDKTIAMAKQLIAAKLNVANGTDASCIADTIAAADAWLAAHGGIGSGQRQWDEGDILHDDLDAYNNGLLCAPHRD